MNRARFLALLEKTILLFDGGYGSEFFKAGFGNVPGVLLNRDEPDVVRDLYTRYAAAGADILTVNSFSSNRIKLAELGYESLLRELNEKAVSLALEAASKTPNGIVPGGRALVFGDLSSPGVLPAPNGTATSGQITDNYAEQAAILKAAGVDGLLLETISDLKEAKCAVRGIRQAAPDLPLIVQMTFDARGRTLTGSSPEIFAAVMNDLDVDVIGINCSLDPYAMLPIFKELASRSFKPVSCEPNAGAPELEDDRPVYRMTSEKFARLTEEYADSGVNIFGGCCGSTPDHIAAVKKALGSRVPRKRQPDGAQLLCSGMTAVKADDFVVIGERINPASRKKFQAELQEGNLETLLAEAQAQRDAGTTVIDLNFGIEKLVTKETVVKAVNELQRIGSPPVCFDIQSPELLDAALSEYAGRPLVNSSKADPESTAAAAELLKKHGGMLVLLALSGDVAPDAAGRLAAAETGLLNLSAKGIWADRIFVDPLVLSIGTGADWRVTLDAITGLSSRGIKTTVGLSNLSFGMPERNSINAAFAAIAVNAGLSAAIMDPTDDIVAKAVRGALVLKHGRKRDESRDESYPPMVQALLRGRKKAANDLLSAATGAEEGREILKNAMETIGELYEKGKLFLPELLFAAEVSTPLFESLAQTPGGEADASAPLILLATVEGDIHDIGKNIIGVVLKSSGYRVEDLGKNVGCAALTAAANDRGAAMVGLSAMMTTTVGKIADAKEAFDAANLKVPIIAGGASMSRTLADRYGVSYAKNGPECLERVRALLGK